MPDTTHEVGASRAPLASQRLRTNRPQRFEMLRHLYDEDRIDAAAGLIRLVFGMRRQCRLHVSFLEYAAHTPEDLAILRRSRWWRHPRWANTLNV